MGQQGPGTTPQPSWRGPGVAMISPRLSSDLEVKRVSRMGWRRRWWGLAGTWRWHQGRRGTSLQPQHRQQLPPAPSKGDALGRRGSMSISRDSHPRWGDTGQAGRGTQAKLGLLTSPPRCETPRSPGSRWLWPRGRPCRR